MNQTQQMLADLIINFAVETISGQMSGLYKAITSGMLQGVNKPALKSGVVSSVFSQTIPSYLNQCYRGLIRGDDRNVVAKFKEMTDLMKHSEICLLNMIAMLITELIGNIDLLQLDTDTLDAYMFSVRSQLVRAKNQYIDKLAQSLHHDCSGEDIKKCDPDVPMFHAGSPVD